MPLKKTVAMERRIDLASLFCLIARHGPAVLVTLVVLGCSLAGFIMFRNMREKRRRRAAAGADRRDSHAGHRDAALGLGEDEEPCAELEDSQRGSTDASDEEHTYHSHVRHRRASPERNLYKDELHEGETAVDRSSYSFFWHRCSPKATESRADETRYNSERSYSHPSAEGVTEEVCGAKEPGLINDVGYEEKEKVIEADSSEDITSTAEDVSEEEYTQEEESVQFTFNSQLCSAPTPTLTANDSKETSEGSIMKQEYALENSIAPILKQDEIPSASCTEDQEVTLDKVHNTLQQNLPAQSGKSAAMHHLNYEQQADIPCNDTVSTTLPVEVMEKDLVEAIESEQLKLVDTKGDSLASTDEIVVADLSSNSRQSEPPMSPTFDSEINQNGLCTQKLSHFESDNDNSSNHKDIGLVNTVCPKATSDDCKHISDLEEVSYLHGVNMAEGKSLDHRETTEKVETETSLLSENTSAGGQNHQCQEMLPQVQNGNQAMNNLSDQKDSICEEKQILPVCKENDLNILNQKEGQSSHIDPMHGQSSVHPPTSQSQLYEVMEEETSQSGFAADVGEISSITDTTMQTSDPKRPEGTPDLDSETNLPPTLQSQIENKTDQTCQNDESTDTPNISATTREKIESMVEQMVAEVYKDVTQTALEAKPMQLEENISSELAQGNDSIAPDSLPSNEVVESTVIGSNVAAQSTEDVVNSVSCLNNFTKVEDEVQKDIILTSDALENKNTSATPTDRSNIPVPETVPETVPNPQDSNNLEEERVEHLALDKNIEKEISVSDDAEVKSTELEKHESLEQLDELSVQPIGDINCTVHDNFANEPMVKVVQQETRVEDDCSNMATQMLAETMITCLDISNVEKLEDEKETQSDIEREVVESVATSCRFEQKSEQKESEVVLDSEKGLLSNKSEFEGGNVLLEKQESALESPSSIKAEISENTATPNEVQSEQKESGILVDTSNSLSNTTVKTSKVVIICRTSEASVSTVEMSDSEDDVIEGETCYLEPTSFKSSSCQDHTDINRNPANEEARAEAVASTSDTLTAPAVIEEVSAEETQLTGTGKPLDLTSRVALDIPQYSSASVESIEQVERKDNSACTPSLESGISSMTVSPEKEESSKVICQDVLTTCHVVAEEKASCNILTSDRFVTVTEEDSIIMENGPERSSSPQLSPLEEISNDMSLTNEDSFGSEIEDGYHKATEELMTQVVDNIKSTGECVTKVVVTKLDGKKEQACAANKEKAENLDSEKTEISIMEATMDHNEWITDGNYQVLPWMAAASFSKDATSSKEAKDVTENKPQAQTSCTEDSVENAKKVLAVQPMPQNVNVTFRVHYVTLTPNQTVAVTGDQPELGAWKSVIPLVKTKDGYWTCVVGLPAESHVEWKFVVLEKGEVCRWEECGNRRLYTGYGDDLLVHKWWGFL